ncbi:MAG: helicase-exonuclease AddAB subunit AddA [Clostridia bacterium]|nr:helicase-exonuclease AddAB subunit AddA [Clostridia bacterium]
MSFPTDTQRKAIENKGAMLVSAAAGSGKTAVLVERVVQRVTDPHDPTDIDRMLVVTFTNAAAAEMKERIRKRLNEEYSKDPLNQRLLTQQILLAKADIATIDSFCKNLITRYFDRLDLSPDFNLISGNRLDLMKKNAMKETLDAFFIHSPESFMELAKTVGADNGTANLQQAVETIYTYLRSLPFPQVWVEMVRQQYHNFTSMEESVWGKVLLERAYRILERGATFLQEVIEKIEQDPVVAAKRSACIAECLSAMEHALQMVKTGSWNEMVSACRGIEKISFQGKVLPRGHESYEKSLSVAAQDVSATVASSLKKMLFMTAEECAEQCALLTPMIDLLLDLVLDYSRRIDEKKKAEGAMDFSDVEYAALSLLVTEQNGKAVPTELAQSICDEYDYVMVDEYQDVNDLQSTIFKAISGNGANLFTVGDVKQSIYRFRKANPGIFLDMLERYPAYDGSNSPAKLVLDGNFRSRPEVCHTVNGLFGLVMSRYVGEIDYDQEHALRPSKEFPKAEAPVSQMEFLKASDDRTAVELEADHIANLIHQAMATPCVTAKDNTLRPACYGDCVILMRGIKERGEQYANRLRAHGIPVVTERGGDFFERPEVARILGVLRAVDNPTDDVALLACIMSPLFGFTAEEVARIRGKEKWIPLYLSVKQAAEQGNEKAGRILTVLQDLRVLASTVSAPRLLTRLYETYGYLSAVQVMENGAQCHRNLLRLREMAIECSENGMDRLDSFLRYTDRLQAEGVAVDPAASTAESDAVRIMTIHHSKGLQFPICFVAGCGVGFNHTDATAPLLLDESLGVGLTVTDDRRQMRSASCMRLGIHYCNRRAELSEELRVLYVAMTRAVDRLVMLATYKNLPSTLAKCGVALSGAVTNGRLNAELVLSATDYGKLLLYYGLLHPEGKELRAQQVADWDLISDQEDCCAFHIVNSSSVARPPLRAEVLEPDPRDPLLEQQIYANLAYQDPYAPLQELFSKRSVSQLSHEKPVVAYERAPRPSFMHKSGMSAAARGTALHTFMQYADYVAAAQDVEKEITRLVQGRFITEQQADVIDRNRLQAFFASELYKRMSTSSNVMREHRFMSALPATLLNPTLPERFASEQVVVQGITDCVFYEDDALVLVDYKTDRVNTPEELVERYAEQLHLYAKMLTETYQMPVKEMILYSFHLNCQVRVALPAL